MKSQIFDRTRFLNCLRCYLGENRRSLQMSALIMLTLPTILTLIFTWMSLDMYQHGRFAEQSSLYDPGQWILGSVLVGCTALFGAISGAKMFSTLSTKHSRVNELTLPASVLEKFLTLFLIYFFGFLVVMFLSVNLANILRVVLFSIDPAARAGMIMLSFKELMLCDLEYPEASWLAWGMVLLFPAVYSLGSSLWPKHGFLKTTVCCILLSIATSTLSSVTLIPITFSAGVIEPRFDFDVRTVLAMLAAAEFAVVIFCYLVSYFRLKEWEVIDRW